MITLKMLENAQKVAFLVEQYPEHNLGQIISLLEMPAIDINAAIWAAQDSGYISVPDKKGKAKLVKPLKKWNFGETEEEVEQLILYCLVKLAEKENDIEENYLGTWTKGYAAHDVMIALKRLIKDKVVATYSIVDKDESEYVFYTLYENNEQLWGRRQFKKDPLAERKGKK